MRKKILLTILAGLVALGSLAYADDKTTTECDGEVCVVKPVKKEEKKKEK